MLDSVELERFLAAAIEIEPAAHALVLFLADTGARLGEASALRWCDLDLDLGTARIARSDSDGRDLRPTESGRERTIELSKRLCRRPGSRFRGFRSAIATAIAVG